MALNTAYDPVLSRVRLTGTLIDPATSATFERSTNNVHWTIVRGGFQAPVSAGDEARVDDYEFVPGVVNYYRVTGGSDVYTASITPSQSGTWLKSIARPFLNRSVVVTEHSDITRPARVGIHEIIGSQLPVARSDVRGSRRLTMTIKADTVADADALEIILASGDPIFIQDSSGYDIPAGYFAVGDVTRRRYGKISERRWFDLPLIEAAAPGPDVVGATSTWQTLVNEFGTWTAVLAAFGTWAAVVEYVSDPSMVIV